MNEKINWTAENTAEKMQMYEQLVFEEIERLGKNGYAIGDGKTAEVLILKEQSGVCLKAIGKKDKCLNRANMEMEFLDKMAELGFPVPKAICALETEEGKDYLFMERVEGFSVNDFVTKNLFSELPPNFDFMKFFKELRDIAAKMHEKKIFHRDLRGGNIMIDKSGKPVIIDFGDAVVNHLSSEDPYRIINQKGESIFYTSDEDNITETLKEVRSYLINKMSEKGKGGKTYAENVTRM